MKVMLFRGGLLSLALAMLAGCASGYQSFYTPSAGATPEAVARLRVAPPPATPLLERFAPADPETIVAAYAKRGYAVIGHSMFNSGGSESEASAIKQGQSVGADLVLVLNPQYTGSITTAVPLTTPTTSTSYTTGSATAYGSGGSATVYGNATTTIRGSQTTYMPMTTHRSDYGAVFFVKRRFNFGAFTRDLNDKERQDLQTNQGVVVTVIVDNTPAFTADVLPGDVIAAIDGMSVPNAEGFNRMMDERQGKRVSLSLVRRGQKNEKSVQLNN